MTYLDYGLLKGFRPTLERGPIWDLLLDLFLEVQMVSYPLRMVSYHGSSDAHEIYTTGNPRVHGMLHHTYTIPLEMGPNRVSDTSQDGVSCGSESDLRSSKVVTHR